MQTPTWGVNKAGRSGMGPLGCWESSFAYPLMTDAVMTHDAYQNREEPHGLAQGAGLHSHDPHGEEPHCLLIASIRTQCFIAKTHLGERHIPFRLLVSSAASPSRSNRDLAPLFKVWRHRWCGAQNSVGRYHESRSEEFVKETINETYFD